MKNIFIYLCGVLAVPQLVQALRFKPKFAGSIPNGVAGILHWQSFRPHYYPGVDSASNRNACQESKEGRFVGLKIFLPSCTECLEIWEPQPPGTLWTYDGPYWDCFTFTFNFTDIFTGYSTPTSASNSSYSSRWDCNFIPYLKITTVMVAETTVNVYIFTRLNSDKPTQRTVIRCCLQPRHHSVSQHKAFDLL